MSERQATAKLIAKHIEDPDAQWSLGTFGGIAEFARDRDEHVVIGLSDRSLSAVTPRGGIRISPSETMTPFASESIARLGWAHRVSLCLPEQDCAMNQRRVLTEIGPDDAPLRTSDHGAILFDLGLDVKQADLCIRVADPAVAAELRKCAGRNVFDPANPAMRIILAANPHRVFVSRIGRAEVYQPIPSANGKSPDGPHTHVLPRLLQHRRTHAATEPVPDGFVPCAHLYPQHPIKDAFGREKPFDDASHYAFQELLEKFGAPEATALKTRVIALVEARQGPESMPTALDRLSRTTIRVALRQLKAKGHASAALNAWLALHEHAEEDETDDDTQTLGH
jgi:Family of unknown function (DUF6925)